MRGGRARDAAPRPAFGFRTPPARAAEQRASGGRGGAPRFGVRAQSPGERGSRRGGPEGQSAARSRGDRASRTGRSRGQRRGLRAPGARAAGADPQRILPVEETLVPLLAGFLRASGAARISGLGASGPGGAGRGCRRGRRRRRYRLELDQGQRDELVGLLLIGVAAWGKGLGLVSSIHIIGGVIAVGVFLLLIAVAGLVGAVNHHQVLLFFYMIILGLVFIFQFGISCSCLAINRNKQIDVINASWWVMSNSTQHELERSFDCCGLFNLTAPYLQDNTSCDAMCKTRSSVCQLCGEKFLKHSDKALKILGGVGLFFSFTEILGVWLAMRFRNQKDPRANPSAFL